MLDDDRNINRSMSLRRSNFTNSYIIIVGGTITTTTITTTTIITNINISYYTRHYYYGVTNIITSRN